MNHSIRVEHIKSLEWNSNSLSMGEWVNFSKLTWNFTLMKKMMKRNKLHAEFVDIKNIRTWDLVDHIVSQSGDTDKDGTPILIEILPGQLLFVRGMNRALTDLERGNEKIKAYVIPLEMQMMCLIDSASFQLVKRLSLSLLL